jgi:hypothetical protein
MVEAFLELSLPSDFLVYLILIYYAFPHILKLFFTIFIGKYNK